MKLKKIFAALAATAVAASMAVSASAEVLMSKQHDGTALVEGGGLYEFDMTGYTEDDVAKIAKVVCEVQADSGYCNGSIGANLNGTWSGPQLEAATADVTVWELDTADGALLQYDAETMEFVAPYIKCEFWWVNPIYGEDADGDGEADTITTGTANLLSAKLVDADGNEVLPSGAADEGTTDEGTTDEGTTDEGTTDEGTTDEGTADGDTAPDDGADTGLVGLSLVGLAVAGASVVATKKRK